MTPEQHARIREIFLSACELTSEDRSRSLEQSCGDDAELREEVEALLEHHDALSSESESSNEERAPTPARLKRERFQPGDVFAGRYPIASHLGGGGMGEVYRTHDLTLDVPVAVKFMVAVSPRHLEVLLNEVRLARQVSHPAVCRVFDVGESGGEHFFTMEYVDGQDLRSLLAQVGRLSSDKVLEFARQLCAGLAETHAKGVLHRDLKPANIMMDANGQARITDFGIATPSTPKVADTRLVAGTPAYMAPEQWSSGAELSEPTDLYVLGLVLYEAVTGRPAFAASSTQELVELHRHADPTPVSDLVPGIDPQLERVILHTLKKDPRERPASAVAMAAELPEEVNALEALTAGVFVGRTSELERLHADLDQAITGAGRLALLVGEPGIGKTRTAEEVMTSARRQNVRVLAGRCYEGEGAPVYWPWMQIVRVYIHDREPATLRREMGTGAAAIGQVIPQVTERLADLPPLPPLEPEQARFRLFDSITVFLKNASQKRPLLLVLDDLHWADKPSLLLLHFVTRALQGSRIFVLGTYRDVEVQRGHPLAEVLTALRSESVYERVQLRGLPEPEVWAMIEEIGGRALSDDFARTILQRTEGNPFFVEETLRYLVEEQIVYRKQDRWTSDLTPEQMGMPEDVRDVIGRRFTRLSERCNEVLTLASVIGREFSLKALARASELSADDLLEVVEEPIRARLVEAMARTPYQYCFAHTLIRETLYEELTMHPCIHLHRLIGTVLEELYGAEAAAHLGELAHHYVEAAPGGDVDKAVSYATRAAEHAMGHLAYEEEAGHYERTGQALEFKEPSDHRRQCELLLRRGDVLWKGGDTVRSRATFRRTTDLSRRLGPAEFFAEAALGCSRPTATGLVTTQGGQLMTGAVDRFLVELLEEVLTVLPINDSPLRACALARLATVLFTEKSPERRRALSFEAVEMARRLGDEATLAFTLSARRLALWDFQNAEEPLLIETEIVQLAEKVGDPALEQQGRDWRIGSLLQLGDIEAADREIERYIRDAHALRQPHYLWGASQVAAIRAVMKGDLERAEALALEGFAIGQGLGNPWALLLSGTPLYWIRRERGGVKETEEVLQSVLVDAPELVSVRAGLGLLYLDLGRSDEARAEFERIASTGFDNIPRNWAWPAAIAALAVLCGRLKDAKRVKALYDLLIPCAGYNLLIANLICFGSASLFLGLLAEALGWLEVAESHFRAALEFNRKIQAPLLRAQTQLHYAEFLLNHRGPPRRDEALALLDEVLETARVGRVSSSIEF